MCDEECLSGTVRHQNTRKLPSIGVFEGRKHFPWNHVKWGRVMEWHFPLEIPFFHHAFSNRDGPLQNLRIFDGKDLAWKLSTLHRAVKGRYHRSSCLDIVHLQYYDVHLIMLSPPRHHQALQRGYSVYRPRITCSRGYLGTADQGPFCAKT